MRTQSIRWWSLFLVFLLVSLLGWEASVQAAQRRSRRRARTVPSYGNPTEHDTLEGEVGLVREVAARALGNFNGSVVVVEADTGRILSIVNQELALAAGFQPCSVIKLPVALAALEEGLITGDTLVRISENQSINLTEALAYSNNAFFEILGERLGLDTVAAYARLLGFDELAGYKIEGEKPGSFPVQPPARGGVGRLSSFGEGVKVTPLGLAALLAAFANGGTLYYLQYPRTAAEAAAFEPRVKRHLPLQRWLPALRAGMEAAVLYGTGRPSGEGGEHILGKTGTCREDRARLGWFASYGELPAGQRVVVVVLLRGGRTLGGTQAAEMAGEVYRELSEVFPHADRPRPALGVEPAGRAR